MGDIQCDVKLPVPKGHSGHNCERTQTKLWNDLVDKSTYAEIQEILESMNPENLMRFLDFMFITCLHDKELGFSQDRFEFFQDVLLCCPRNILAQFLMGLREDHDVLTLLEGRQDIWLMFFVELFELGQYGSVDYLFNCLLETEFNDDFISNLMHLLANECLNLELDIHVRLMIFYFVTQDSSNIELDELPVMEHRDVDASEFVSNSFASLHPMPQQCDDSCSMCRTSPNEDNSKVFRSMTTCCGQMACHDCLIEWVKICNMPDPEREFKETDKFSCPFCRHKTSFFSPNH